MANLLRARITGQKKGKGKHNPPTSSFDSQTNSQKSTTSISKGDDKDSEDRGSVDELTRPVYDNAQGDDPRATMSEDELEEYATREEDNLEVLEDLLAESDKVDRLRLLRTLTSITCPESWHPLRISQDAKILFAQWLPLLASPLGLLANLSSIIALCERWRFDNQTNTTLVDVWWALLLNALALAAGCLSNICLFLHTHRAISAMWGVMVSSVMYMVAVALYMGMIAGVEFAYYYHGSPYSRTNGYWQGVCASCLYFLSSILLLISLSSRPSIGQGLRSHELEVSRRQKKLMTLYTMFVAWICIGAAASQHIMHITYANGAYYCIVTCLTVGFGDVVAHNVLGQALTIPYFIIGIILGGITTLVLFQSFFGDARKEAISRRVESHRIKMLQKGLDDAEKESFQRMRDITSRAELMSGILRSVMTLLWLSIFWLIGALVFSRTERWTYFQAFYMCAVSMTSVGYGDFTPASPGGRSFFIIWSLIAVPTMTSSVSEVTSLAITIITSSREHRRKPTGEKSALDILILEEMGSIESHRAEVWHGILSVARRPNNTKFEFIVWHDVMCALLDTENLPSNFWLSNDSPLRIPFLNEKHFIILAILHSLRLDTDRATDKPGVLGSLASPLLSRRSIRDDSPDVV